MNARAFRRLELAGLQTGLILDDLGRGPSLPVGEVLKRVRGDEALRTRVDWVEEYESHEQRFWF